MRILLKIKFDLKKICDIFVPRKLSPRSTLFCRSSFANLRYFHRYFAFSLEDIKILSSEIKVLKSHLFNWKFIKDRKKSFFLGHQIVPIFWGKTAKEKNINFQKIFSEAFLSLKLRIFVGVGKIFSCLQSNLSPSAQTRISVEFLRYKVQNFSTR